jgi:hypothetical protein
MNPGMLFNIWLIALGSAALIFRKRFASMNIRFQNRVWGFGFGDREEEASVFVIVVSGLVFVVIGLFGFGA